MQINEVKALKEQFQTGFYKRLINGEIKEAKNTLKFILATFGELNKIIPEVIQNLEEDSANQLNILWQTFKNLFYEFQALAEKELTITEQTFNDDPEVWKELLSSTFKKKVDELSSLLDNMTDLLKVQTKPKEKLPPVEYSSKYTKQKERDNLYSQHKKEINKVELSIRRNIGISIIARKRVTQIKGISKIIQTGVWAGFYHAYLPKPMDDHRIVYSWDGKIVIFEIIGTHKELGIY